jgi:catechol 2,3-dioxygenase-like lactoylglutathione lyase family enzyme
LEIEEVTVLGDKNAIATIAVKDVNVAKKFYEGTLGLKPEPSQEMGTLQYKSGNANVLVYKSDYAGTNKATAATWEVGDKLSNVVQELKSKGVSFEHYNLPGLRVDGDVHTDGKMKVAWLKDPDGNILSLVGR